MSDSVKKVLYGNLYGFRDSIIGIFNVYKMDKTQSEAVAEESHTPTRETVLARRRAERLKSTPMGTKKDRLYLML